MKKCPFCFEEIQEEAIYCRHCHKDLNKPELGGEAQDLFEESIRGYTSKGWVLMNKTQLMAQLKRPKVFNWFWFLVWFLSGFFTAFVPLILFLIIYAVKREPVITLSLTSDGNVETTGNFPVNPFTGKLDTKTSEEKAKTQKWSGKDIATFVVVMIFLCIIVNALASGG